jgi:exo-1,4-beta-D-glucosaminidase
VQGAYFLQLKLEDSAGKPVSTNFYWLSTKPDVLDWDNFTWYYTPAKSFADMRDLASLPPVDVTLVTNSEAKGKERVTRVRVNNPSRTLALYVHLRIVKSQGAADDGIANESEVLPILWEDNYFPLLPGESREVAATYDAPAGRGGKAAVVVDGWNVPPKRLAITLP